MNVDLELEQDALLILETLDNLLYLNGKSTKENKENSEVEENEENEMEDYIKNNNYGGIPETDIKNESDSNENTKQLTLMDKLTSQDNNININHNEKADNNIVINNQNNDNIKIDSNKEIEIIQDNILIEEEDKNYENEMKNLDELLNKEEKKGESLETEIPKFQVYNIYNI